MGRGKVIHPSKRAPSQFNAVETEVRFPITRLPGELGSLKAGSAHFLCRVCCQKRTHHVECDDQPSNRAKPSWGCVALLELRTNRRQWRVLPCPNSEW